MKSFTLLTLLFTFTLIPGHAQNWDWFFTNEAIPDEEIGSAAFATALTNDLDGNVYVNWVSSHPEITFGDQTFTGSDITFRRNFLVKFNSIGDIVWINDTDEDDTINFNSVVTDATGNIYASGSFVGTFNYQNFSFSSGENESFNAFITKMDLNGNMLWAKHITVENDANSENTSKFISAGSIITDSSGNIYICGQMGGSSAIFDTITVPINGNSDNYIAKYDNNGNILWVKTITSNGYQGYYKIVCDSIGNIYFAGAHDGDFPIEFDNNILGGNGISLIFLTKYNSEGEMLWLKSYGGSTINNISFGGLTIDSNDNTYITGHHDYTALLFDNVALNALETNPYEAYVVKSNSDGNIQWAKSSGAFDEIRDIKAGSDAGLYITGNFWSAEITLGNTTLVNEGSANGYIAKLNENGEYIWAEHIGGSSHYEQYLGIDPVHNSLYITGMYSNIRLGEQNYTYNMAGNLFLTKFNMNILSNKDFYTNPIDVYPNPAKNILTINSDILPDSNYSIIDLSGRTIQKGNLLDKSVNVSMLPSGIYVINIDGLKSKFIKE